MAAHAKYSPSGYEGWSNCANWASDPTSSKDADLGTDAHDLAATCLIHDTQAADYIGRVMGKGNIVDVEMVEAITRYVEIIRALPGTRQVEVRLPLESITGEVNAYGTSDAVVIGNDELIVADLKYGKGIPVRAEGNGQLRIYAAAALEQYAIVNDFERVRTMIVQPRLNSVTEEVLTVAQLNEWAESVEPAVEVVPGEKQCRWCKHKADCPAIRGQILELFSEVTPESPDTTLAEIMSKADMIESWIKAIRARVERRLLDGHVVPGWKLVAGKRGARSWTNAVTVEELLKKSMRLTNEEMYSMNLISPTQAEKVLKPKQWERVQEFITQKDGSPSVARESDKRPAIANAAQFEVIN